MIKQSIKLFQPNEVIVLNVRKPGHTCNVKALLLQELCRALLNSPPGEINFTYHISDINADGNVSLTPYECKAIILDWYTVKKDWPGACHYTAWHDGWAVNVTRVAPFPFGDYVYRIRLKIMPYETYEELCNKKIT